MDHKHKCETSNSKISRRMYKKKFLTTLAGTNFLDKIQRTLSRKGKKDILYFCSSNNTFKAG